MSSSNDKMESSEDVSPFSDIEQDESRNEGIDSEVEIVDNIQDFVEDWRLISISV